MSATDLPALIALKADPLVYGRMLGGVRAPLQTIDELAADRIYWAVHRVGMFAIREGRTLHGITGIHTRPDGRGQALRFAVWPDARGRGIAREAASAALRHAHDCAGLPRIVAIAAADNFGSRMVLGSIGMHVFEHFVRDGAAMLTYESKVPRHLHPS